MQAEGSRVQCPQVRGSGALLRLTPARPARVHASGLQLTGRPDQRPLSSEEGALVTALHLARSQPWILHKTTGWKSVSPGQERWSGPGDPAEALQVPAQQTHVTSLSVSRKVSVTS